MQAKLMIQKGRPLKSVNKMELIEIKLDWPLNSSCISKCIVGFLQTLGHRNIRKMIDC